jgi:hypothetical protein
MVVQADVHELAMGGDQKIGPRIRRPMLRLRESCRYVLPNNRADGAEIYVPAISQVENQSYQCRGRASSLLVLYSPSKRSSIQVNEVQNQQLLYSPQGGRRDEHSSKSSRTALHNSMKRKKQNQRPRMALALDIVSEGKRKPAPFYSGTRQLC